MQVKIGNRMLHADEYTLNFISLLADEASKNLESQGRYHIAYKAKEFSLDIYEQLEEAGFYD